MVKISVVGIVTNIHRGKIMVLLTQRDQEPYKDKWSLPFFVIDRYEPTEDVVEREVKEITGLDYTIRFFGYFDEIIPSDDIHGIVLAFECLSAEQLLDDKNEIEDLSWFSIKEASNLSLAFEHNKILDAYTDKRKGGIVRYLVRHGLKYTMRYLLGLIGLRYPIIKL